MKFKDLWKQTSVTRLIETEKMGIEAAGPIPQSLLARQDLETTEKSSVGMSLMVLNMMLINSDPSQIIDKVHQKFPDVSTTEIRSMIEDLAVPDRKKKVTADKTSKDFDEEADSVQDEKSAEKASGGSGTDVLRWAYEQYKKNTDIGLTGLRDMIMQEFGWSKDKAQSIAASAIRMWQTEKSIPAIVSEIRRSQEEKQMKEMQARKSVSKGAFKEFYRKL